MITSILILTLVTAQRVGELFYARHNTQRLIARGGREFGAVHYPAIVALHAAWLIGLWYFAWDKEVVWTFALFYLALQAFRVWMLVSIGDRWTTRIIVLPGEPLVAKGPYRFLRHPNYALVVFEIACLPMVFGMWFFAIVFTLLNGVVLGWRIRTEEQALKHWGAEPERR
jgi:methyltransferase